MEQNERLARLEVKMDQVADGQEKLTVILEELVRQKKTIEVVEQDILEVRESVKRVHTRVDQVEAKDEEKSKLFQNLLLKAVLALSALALAGPAGVEAIVKLFGG